MDDGYRAGVSEAMHPARQSPAPARSQTVYWVIAVLLAAIAGGLWSRPAGQILPAAWAQNQPLAGARGVYAFTGQLDHNQYGLFMLDVDQGTIWCYEIDLVDGTRKLRLIAARSWVYDRYLQDFNCAAPDFRMVQQLVAQQRTPEAGMNRTPPAGTASGQQRAPESNADSEEK